LLNKNKHSIRQNTETVLVTSEKVGSKVNAEKTKYYMFMYYQQNAEKNHKTAIGNKSFRRKAKFRHLGTTITNHTFMHTEFKSD